MIKYKLTIIRNGKPVTLDESFDSHNLAIAHYLDCYMDDPFVIFGSIEAVVEDPKVNIMFYVLFCLSTAIICVCGAYFIMEAFPWDSIDLF